MDTWIKLNASTTGKDKLFRLVQYLSRLLWYRLESRKHLRDTVDRLRVLEASISTFRKLLRLGKSLEVVYGALRTLHLPDLVLRTSLTLSRIYQAFFLLADHIIWLGRAGLCEIDRDKWGRLSNRFWLGSIICNLFRDGYEILQLLQKKMKHTDLTIFFFFFFGCHMTSLLLHLISTTIFFFFFGSYMTSLLPPKHQKISTDETHRPHHQQHTMRLPNTTLGANAVPHRPIVPPHGNPGRHTPGRTLGHREEPV
ncbi:hypothetical protein Pcinc_029028 [Petrolisthes cinctipes]|uniref:Peroxisomal membrane protein 11B n=1 Tax=Petrolisthes cinctipes TaxID=88211 RepID=A0AAE1K6I3_PETCI|nr:hypothetical protein Pcinc_029028 [Petrolisthes cinctipes]